MEKRKPLVIGVDLGATRLRVAVIDSGGNILKRISTATLAEQGREAVIGRLVSAIEESLPHADKKQVTGIGVSVAGPVDGQKGVVVKPANLPGWLNVPLKALLEDRFNLPVELGNDANLAALGEYRFGAGREARNMVYITVSTGIGGGIITDGRLLLGDRGMAGEIGHMIIEPDGPRCGCGGKGHLEALASGTAIARAAKEGIAAGRQSMIDELARQEGKPVTSEIVVAAARLGDSLALEVLSKASRSLCIGVVNLLHLLNPELIIFGGGVSNAWDLIIQPVESMVKERAMAGFAEKVRIVPSALGDDAGLLGAAALWLK